MYPGLKSFIDTNEIESEIKEEYEKENENFECKCRTGENDSYICTLIRQDLVEEFSSYTTRSNTSLSNRIEPSIYETIFFLLEKRQTLIEYASFYGSIQIVRYLQYNNVPLSDSLWLYAVHSNNADLIHFLEENKVRQESSYKLYEESVICHHNDVAGYIKDNFLNEIEIGHFALLKEEL